MCYSVFYNGGINSCESVRGRVWEGLKRQMTVQSVKCVVVCAGLPSTIYFFIQADYGPPAIRLWVEPLTGLMSQSIQAGMEKGRDNIV